VTLSRPLVCLVTDRSRLTAFGPRAEDGRGDPWDALVELLGLAAEAGVDLLQVREPDLSSRELFSLVSRVVERTASTASRVVVNDRADVALAAGADVHLKGESMPTGLVRTLVPEGRLVGRSVHTVEGAVEASHGGADYVIFGTVFETRSKLAGQRPAGLSRLRDVVASVRIPVLAIGGMTVDRLPEVAATGAAGVAAIGLFHGGAPGSESGSGEREPSLRLRTHLEDVVMAVKRTFV